MRRVLSALLIVAGCLCAPVAVTAAWTANQITDTDRYVATVSPLADDPAVRNAVADQVTAVIMTELNVPRLVGNASGALPPKAGKLVSLVSGPAASFVRGFVREQTGEVLASDGFGTVWDQTNRIAHGRINLILSGDDAALVQTGGETVDLELGPLVAAVKERLIADGMTVAEQIPDVNPTFALIRSDQLAKAQTYYGWAGVLKWLAPLLSLLLVAGGVLLARGRRRALVRAALGVAAG
ncbi:hypothetical protein, partial [Actinocorallia lasiicapitis]